MSSFSGRPEFDQSSPTQPKIDIPEPNPNKISDHTG